MWRVAAARAGGWKSGVTPSSSSSSRNLEKEISFDFGASGEFSYLYDQCYEMTTSEYVPDGGTSLCSCIL